MRSTIPMLAILLFTTTASAAIITGDALVDFQVDAYAPVGDGPYATHVAAWMDTGLFLNAGDEFALVAVGIAFESPASPGRTPEGDFSPRCAFWDSIEHCIVDIPNSRYSLVGKIGTDLGDEFYVGSSFSGIANDTGYLYLAFNDSHYTDNSGFYTVSTAPVPEPSTALLLSMGLCGLAITRERRNHDRLVLRRRGVREQYWRENRDVPSSRSGDRTRCGQEPKTEPFRALKSRAGRP